MGFAGFGMTAQVVFAYVGFCFANTACQPDAIQDSHHALPEQFTGNGQGWAIVKFMRKAGGAVHIISPQNSPGAQNLPLVFSADSTCSAVKKAACSVTSLQQQSSTEKRDGYIKIFTQKSMVSAFNCG
jgi:hypothetical protein